MNQATNLAIDWVEQGRVPDTFIRAGIRRLLKQRLREIGANDIGIAAELNEAFADALWAAPVALSTEKANAQHYEVPAEFFAKVLGQHRKYSSCWWPDGVNTLDQAEAAGLQEPVVDAPDAVDPDALAGLGPVGVDRRHRACVDRGQVRPLAGVADGVDVGHVLAGDVQGTLVRLQR